MEAETNKLRRVMLVDDDETVRLIGRLALQRGGLEVFDYASGPQALEALPTVQPDLMLLDVMMPGMSGLEVLSRLRTMSPWAQLPVVFLTARFTPSDVADYLSRGALDVFAKPFDVAKLPQRLRDLFLAGQQR